jgi:hypothetical protein
VQTMFDAKPSRISAGIPLLQSILLARTSRVKNVIRNNPSKTTEIIDNLL